MLKRGGKSLHIVPTPAKMLGCLAPVARYLVFGNPTPECLAVITEAAELRVALFCLRVAIFDLQDVRKDL